MTDLNTQWLERFNQSFHKRPRASFQRQAMDYVNQHGLPTTQLEAWKYTTLAKFLEPEQEAADTSVAISEQPGLMIYRYTADAPDSPTKLAPALQSLLSPENFMDAMQALGQALCQETLVLVIADNQTLNEPIEITYQGEHGRHSYLVVLAGQNSRFELREFFSSAGPLHNQVCQLHLAQSSQCRHLRVHNESAQTAHVSSVQVFQEQNSNYHSFSLSINGKLIRQNQQINLTGANAACQTDGLLFAKDKQHVDHRVEINHKTPHCSSNALFKSLADDHATLVFNGRIHIYPHASFSDGALYCKNLLLSPHSQVNAKPELEIYNDNVKCTHGATTGALDEAQMLYLRSRGLNIEQSRALLIQSFVQEVLQRSFYPAEQLRPFLPDRLSHV